MIWLAVIGLALGAFAVGAFALGLARGLWTSMLATLALGLAGYGLQSRGDLAAAPAAGRGVAEGALFDLAEARHELVAPADRSRSDLMMLADGMARQGRYADAIALLGGATAADPGDFEAWLAKGNALVEHTQGVLTPAALYAYREAARLRPEHIAPNYFLGVALIRQGRLIEAYEIWRDALQQAGPDAAGRAALAERVMRLETMLGMMASMTEGAAAAERGAPAPPDEPQAGGGPAPR